MVTENPVYAIEVHNLQKSYTVGATTVHALAGVSFVVQPGECVAIVGASGCGKSTLLHILGTLDIPTSGSVRIAGQDPFCGSDKQISAFRNKHIGFVFQQNNLLPELSAIENIMLPALIGGTNKHDARRQAAHLLDRVQLTARSDHFPSQLSGGEQQRVAIARAFINNPSLLLADEPSGNLDSVNAQRVHNLFLEMNASHGTTMLLVTHNGQFAASLPRQILLKDGSIVV